MSSVIPCVRLAPIAGHLQQGVRRIPVTRSATDLRAGYLPRKFARANTVGRVQVDETSHHLREILAAGGLRLSDRSIDLRYPLCLDILLEHDAVQRFGRCTLWNGPLVDRSSQLLSRERNCRHLEAELRCDGLFHEGGDLGWAQFGLADHIARLDVRADVLESGFSQDLAQ